MDNVRFNEKEKDSSFDFQGTISRTLPFLKHLTKFILHEKDLILCRQNIYKDVLDSTTLLDFFSQLFEKINSLSYLKAQGKGLPDNNERLYNSLIYPKYYLELINYINTERKKLILIIYIQKK